MPDFEPGSKVLVWLFWILVVSKSKDFLLYAYIAETGWFLFLLNKNFQEKSVPPSLNEQGGTLFGKGAECGWNRR